jgi:hypothetical protein
LPLSPISAGKQDDTDTVTGADLGTTTNVGDHAAHHNALATNVNALVGEKVINVKTDYAAKGDVKQVVDGAMTSGSAVLTSATAAFTAADVGKLVSVTRATATTFELYAKIVTVTNATTIQLAMPAGVSLTAQTLLINGNSRAVDAVTTAGSTQVTSATAAFTSADVNAQVRIAAAQAAALNTSIASYTSATQVTLATTAGRTVSGAQVTWGTDDTTAFITAFEAARDNSPASVYIPKGWYLVEPRAGDTTAALIYSNTRVFGDGPASIVRQVGGIGTPGTSVATFGINTWSRGTSNPDQNASGIVIEHLQMQGTTVEDGFFQWSHNISINAATDVTVRSCKFAGWRGDAVYIGSGTSTSTLERHNRQIKVYSCYFDGVNWDNRQGISIIDGDDVSIWNCSFWNTTRANMPGAIDIEPNPANAFPIVRSIRISSCYFRNTGGNTGVIGMALLSPQSTLTTPMRGYLITDCVVVDPINNAGIFMQQSQYPTDTTPRNDVSVRGCWFYNVNYVCEIEGAKGFEFSNNFVNTSTSSLILGYSFKCLDVLISNNSFIDVGRAGGYALELTQAERVTVEANRFEQIGDPGLSQGHIFRFTSGGSIGTPSGVTVTPGASSGATTYGYRVTAMRDNTHETTASATVTIASRPATLTALNYNRVSWAAQPGAAGFRVYGRTSGGELLMATLGPEVYTWDDTGAVTPSGALPGSDTSTWGNTRGIQALSNSIRQGATNRITAISSMSASHTTIDIENVYKNNSVPAGSLSITPFLDASVGFRQPVRVASTANVTLPPGGTTLTIDGTVLANGDRVLLKDQTTVANNGIYVVSGIGTSVVLTRAADARDRQALADVMVVPVEAGNLSGNTFWQLTTTNPVTVGTTALRFTRIVPSYQMPILNNWAVSGDTLQVIGETTPRALATSTLTLPTAATHTLFGGIVLPAGRTITNVNFHYTTAAATITIFYVSLIRASDRLVLATSANSTAAWAAAPATKTGALSTPYTPDVDTPVYVGIALAATTAPVIDANPARAATGNYARPPILVGSTTTPTTTPITGTAAALTATLSMAYCWLT